MFKLRQTAAAAKVVTRAKTRDVAFAFRMGTGYPGDVNRTNPFSILPYLGNSTNAPDFYGNAVLTDASTNSARKILTTDSAITTIDGIVVRPYPTQQASGGMTATMGVATPPVGGVLDILKSGYFRSKVVGTAVKDTPAYLWVAASTGAHVLGGFEAAATVGSTVALTNVFFNGPAGPDGVAELFIRSK